jgi:molecular chaperone GrpE
VTTRKRVPPEETEAEADHVPLPRPAGGTSPPSGEESPVSVPKDTYLRLAADFENYRKRARQEQLDTVQYATATLVERLLPVVDDLHRSLEHAPPEVDEKWLKGVQLTLQKLDEALEGVGVSRIQAIGARFDPKVHEAIGSAESVEYPDDTVIDELRPGYRLHDRVLRPALVRVSRQPAPTG